MTDHTPAAKDQERALLETAAHMRPSLSPAARHEFFVVLRQHWAEFGPSARLKALVCERLHLDETAFQLALNRPEVITAGVSALPEWDDRAKALFHRICEHKNPVTKQKGEISKKRLIHSYAKGFGATIGLMGYVALFKQHHLIRESTRKPKGKEHYKRGAIWYEVVKV